MKNLITRVALVVVLSFVSLDQTHGQDSDATDRIEMMYMVKNTPATDLATVLEKFLADARNVEVVVEPQSNVLLMRAPKDAMDRIKSILEGLDRPPSMIAVEAWLVVGDADATTAIDLSAKADDPLKQLKVLQSKGQVTLINHLRLSTLDNQPCFVQVGERTPTVRSISSAASQRSRTSGSTARSYSYDSIGTLVKVTPRVTGDRTIAMEVQIEKSRLDQKKESEDSPMPPTIVTSTFESTVRVADGGATLLSGSTANENGNEAVSFVIIRATILDRH